CPSFHNSRSSFATCLTIGTMRWLSGSSPRNNSPSRSSPPRAFTCRLVLPTTVADSPEDWSVAPGTALFAGVVCSEPLFCAHRLTCIRTLNAIPNPKLRNDKVASNLETSRHLDCDADRVRQLRGFQRGLPFR